MRKITILFVLSLLVLSMFTVGSMAAENYVPCETPGCTGRIISGTDIEQVPRYRACKKYPSTYMDVALDTYYRNWEECTECAYSWDERVPGSKGSFVCNH